jgi:hypothetical protein
VALGRGMRFPLAERCSGAAMRMIRKLLESYLAWLCKVFQVMPDSLRDGRAREPPTPVGRDQFALARSITSAGVPACAPTPGGSLMARL